MCFSRREARVGERGVAQGPSQALVKLRRGSWGAVSGTVHARCATGRRARGRCRSCGSRGIRGVPKGHEEVDRYRLRLHRDALLRHPPLEVIKACQNRSRIQIGVRLVYCP